MFAVARIGRCLYGSPDNPATPVVTVAETFENENDGADILHFWQNPPRDMNLRGKFTYKIITLPAEYENSVVIPFSLTA